MINDLFAEFASTALMIAFGAALDTDGVLVVS